MKAGHDLLNQKGALQSLSSPEKEGWLGHAKIKHLDVFQAKDLNHRYCVLHRGILYWFKKYEQRSDVRKAKGSLSLKGGGVVESLSLSKADGLSFVIYIMMGSEEFCLRADASRNEHDWWLYLLKMAAGYGEESHPQRETLKPPGEKESWAKRHMSLPAMNKKKKLGLSGTAKSKKITDDFPKTRKRSDAPPPLPSQIRPPAAPDSPTFTRRDSDYGRQRSDIDGMTDSQYLDEILERRANVIVSDIDAKLLQLADETMTEMDTNILNFNPFARENQPSPPRLAPTPVALTVPTSTTNRGPTPPTSPHPDDVPLANSFATPSPGPTSPLASLTTGPTPPTSPHPEDSLVVPPSTTSRGPTPPPPPPRAHDSSLPGGSGPDSEPEEAEEFSMSSMGLFVI